MAINFPNDPSTNPGNGGQWTDPGGSGTWEVELINGEAIWTLVSTDGGGGGGGAVSLNELNDVTLSSPADQNVLQYNQATGKWINAPAPSAGNVNLNDLGDVDTTAGTTGDVLVKQSNGNWEAQTPANNGGIGEAPEDGSPYVRQDAGWISMPNGGGGAAEPELTFDIGATGTTSYDFTGPGFTSSTANPLLTLVRGQTYKFNNTSGSHPFQIQSTEGLGGTAYSDGVTGNNTVGLVEFEVPFDAPDKLYYQCTVHADMKGELDVLAQGSGGATLNIDEAPADGVAYTRKNNTWVPGVESVTGSTAQIEGDNNIDTGTNTRAVSTGHVLTYDGSKFAPAAPTGGGGGGGVEEAPNDGNLYARRNEAWAPLQNDDSVVWGKLSISGNEAVVNFEDIGAAAEAGFTQVTLGSDPDDGMTAVQLPAEFNGVSWFGTSDPDEGSNGYQTLFVNGNGYAAFMPTAIATGPNTGFPSYEYGYDPVNSTTENSDLIFGFLNTDLQLMMVCTKQVGEYFVVHIQWEDIYSYIKESVGGAASFLPYAAYDPNAGGIRSGKTKPKPRNIANALITCELWLGKNGGVQMKYGINPVALSIVEESAANGFSQQTNGIYKKGTPVTEVMGAALSFQTLPSNELIYSPTQNNDGADSTAGDIFDWYISYTPSTVPYLSDAPSDGTIYARQDGNWVEAAGAGGGGAAPDEFYYAPQSRRMAQGLLAATPYSSYTNIEDGTPIVRPKEALLCLFYYGQAQGFGNEGVWNLQADDILFIAREDYNYNRTFNGNEVADLELLTEEYQANDILFDVNGNVTRTVFLFGTATFWRQYPGEENEWRLVHVDFHVPIDTSITPTAPNDFHGLKIDTSFYGTGTDDVKSFVDFIGCTQAELDGTNIPSTPPDVIQDSDWGIGVTLQLYTRTNNDNNSGGGGGGGGAPAKSRENKQTRDILDFDANLSGGIVPTDGCVLTYRVDPFFSQNLGSGGGGFPERKSGEPLPTPEERKAEMIKRSKERNAEKLKNLPPEAKLAKSHPAAKKNPGGLGSQIPGYSEPTDDPRALFNRTVNCQAPRFQGSVQLDKLGFWDLWQVDTTIKNTTPTNGESIVWDSLNEEWTLSGNVSRSADYTVERIITAIQENPELKAALKAALS